MKKVLILYVALVVVVAIFFFARGSNLLNLSIPGFGNGAANENVSNATAKVGDKTYKLILAKTDEEKIKGLSGRENLAKDTGMLFVFEEKGRYGFWMNNMRFPIDILYISDNKIVDIVENAPAPKEGQDPSTLPVYNPSGDINYVLELAAGEVKATNAKEGDTVELKGL